MNSSIGLIGVGNMGTAILEGLLQKKRVAPASVWVYDKISQKAEQFSARWGSVCAKSNAEVLKNSEVVLLAVKPQDLDETVKEFKNFFKDSQILISILAGTPIDKVRKAAGPRPLIVRAMPNLGAKVGEAVTALAGSDRKALRLAQEIFSGCGKTLELEEKYFDLVTALSGSGPAYFFLLMELMAQEGVASGLSPEKAELLAVQTALGAVLLAASSKTSPAELRKMVTSKGGTTEAALQVFEGEDFAGMVKKAVKAAVDRGKELSL